MTGDMQLEPLTIEYPMVNDCVTHCVPHSVRRTVRMYTSMFYLIICHCKFSAAMREYIYLAFVCAYLCSRV